MLRSAARGLLRPVEFVLTAPLKLTRAAVRTVLSHEKTRHEHPEPGPVTRDRTVPTAEAKSPRPASVAGTEAPSPPLGSGATTEAPPPPAVPEPHIETEDELVASSSDAGAEDGAGAQIGIGEPWVGYRGMHAPEIVDRIALADTAELALVQLFEAANRNRVTVIRAVEDRLKETDRSAA